MNIKIENRTNISHAWMVFFGHENPITDTRRIKTNVYFSGIGDDLNEVQSTNEDKKITFFKSKISKKVRRGIAALLKVGIINNSELFRILTDRGFTKKHRSNDCFSRSTMNKYISYVRSEYGFDKTNKRELILEMLRSGIPRNIIRERVNTTNGYILELATQYNLNITRSTTHKSKNNG